MTTETIIDENGSLVLTYDESLDQHWVSFADWYHVTGTGSLDAVSDWYEICKDSNGQPVKLNGSQAVTVKNWAKKYL